MYSGSAYPGNQPVNTIGATSRRSRSRGIVSGVHGSLVDARVPSDFVPAREHGLQQRRVLVERRDRDRARKPLAARCSRARSGSNRKGDVRRVSLKSRRYDSARRDHEVRRGSPSASLSRSSARAEREPKIEVRRDGIAGGRTRGTPTTPPARRSASSDDVRSPGRRSSACIGPSPGRVRHARTAGRVGDLAVESTDTRDVAGTHAPLNRVDVPVRASRPSRVVIRNGPLTTCSTRVHPLAPSRSIAWRG